MNTKTVLLGVALASLAACGGNNNKIWREAPPQRASTPQKKVATASAPAPAPKPAPAPAATTAEVKEAKVPPGHMPPAGKCRIWHPGKPPGQQPPVGECAVLKKQVPAGAVLVEGPAAKPAKKPAVVATAAPGGVQVKVPPGHMPPKGKCRLWYEGRSASLQPPVGECTALEKKIPQGAVLVRG
jgi:hypothetical protein